MKNLILASLVVLLFVGCSLGYKGYTMALSEQRRIAVNRMLVDLTTDLNTTEGLSNLGYDALLTLLKEFYGEPAQQNLESCVIQISENERWTLPVENLEKFNDWFYSLPVPE